jgi:anti-sigma factor RsiW
MSVSNHSSSCETPRSTIIALIDGELTAQADAELRAHLGLCDNCASYYKSCLVLLETVGGIDLDLPATDTAGTRRDAARTRDNPGTVASLDAETRAMRAEMQAMRAEMAEMRRQLAVLSGQIARTPPRPSARTLFPYSAPTDRLRQES